MIPRALVLAMAAAILAPSFACSGRTAAPADGVGVAECDEYYAKIQACLSRDPRVKAMEPAYKAQQDAWKQMVKTDRATVQRNCKAALASFTASMPLCQ
jgi:hypothetical protein